MTLETASDLSALPQAALCLTFVTLEFSSRHCEVSVLNKVSQYYRRVCNRSGTAAVCGLGPIQKGADGKQWHSIALFF